jgi:hypothetical protein
MNLSFTSTVCRVAVRERPQAPAMLHFFRTELNRNLVHQLTVLDYARRAECSATLGQCARFGLLSDARGRHLNNRKMDEIHTSIITDASICAVNEIIYFVK